MPTLVKVLDGRRDANKLDHYDHTVVLFEPAKERYKTTQESPAVTKLKVAIIDIMFGIANLRSNLRLANFLQYFKTINSSKGEQKLLILHNKVS